jgi:hypothetical protein
MTRYFGTLALGFAITAACVAAFWRATPWLTGEHPPAGLLGMFTAMGIIASLAMARRKLPPADREQGPS